MINIYQAIVENIQLVTVVTDGRLPCVSAER